MYIKIESSSDCVS